MSGERALRAAKLLALSGACLILFFSWFPPEWAGFWYALDLRVFYAFQEALKSNEAARYVLAVVNLRAFDGAALLAMGYLYYRIYQTHGNKRYMLALGAAMLITAAAVNQLGHLIPVERASPTRILPDAVRIGELTGIAAKDGSGDSFPGDHGIMLLIFSGYVWRYFGAYYFRRAILIFFIFSAPRIMIGAHWFTDVYVGSIAIVGALLSWWFLTPASDRLIALFYGKR